MATEFCRECHRPMNDVVAGVRLPIFKVDLFHFIETHPGASSLDLAYYFSKKSNNTIKAHIYQINEALIDTGLRICGGKFTGYYVKKAGGNIEQTRGSHSRARGIQTDQVGAGLSRTSEASRASERARGISKKLA